MATTGFFREIEIPSDLGNSRATAVSGKIVLPLHVAWSGQGELDLDDPDDRRYVYELVLTEGAAEDFRTYVDLDVLVAEWGRLRLAPHVRGQWGEWLRERGLVS